ncbi:MAG: RNA polymerase sigma factor [Ignavibacteria bacterium]|nr:RNA polymerase sigma factor [Ignavibacteria bacterium]
MKSNNTLKTYSDDELFTMLGGTKTESDCGFGELYRRYSYRIFGYCRRIIGDDKAEDVCQEIFLSFLDHGRKQTTVCNVGSYLFRIAQNKTRRFKREETKVALDEFKEELYSAENHNYEQKELNQLVVNALALLPEDQRETLALQVYSGMSYKDIAAVRQVPINTVKSHILRAKKQIRAILLPFFQSESK